MKEFTLSVLIAGLFVLFFAKYEPAVKDAVFTALGTIFAAWIIWLTVRIANSRDRRAIRTVIIVMLVLAYPLSMGPMVWLGEHGYLPRSMERAFNLVLLPVLLTVRHGPPAIGRWMAWYISLWTH